MMRKVLLFLLLSLLSAFCGLDPLRAESPVPPAETPQQKWFRAAKFGMFIHWGVYSVLGDGEWVMNNRGIPVSEYEKLAPQFNPTAYDPADWVALAKAAGIKYITITSKHHDGFAMFATKQSDWNIVDRTPTRRTRSKCSPTSAKSKGSSCSSTIPSSTGTIPTTSRWAAPVTQPAGLQVGTGTSTSTTWTRSSPNC